MNETRGAMVSDDVLAPGPDALAEAIRKGGGTKVKTLHVATDPSWSDARVRLQAEVFGVVGDVANRMIT